jgi:hypothetical protein
MTARLHLLDSLIAAARTAPPDSTGALVSGAVQDSLETLKVAAMQDMGEWFYSELDVPDSAAAWLRSSLASTRRHGATARGLFVMADLAREDSTGGRGSSESYLRRIIDDHPGTPYAGEARKQLGLPGDTEERDRPARLYRAAEEDLEHGAFVSAAARLDSLSRTYPSSSLAGKSLYASGWIYDNRLSLPDSAVVRYRRVIQSFGTSEYAESARRRLPGIAPASADTSASKAPLDPEKQLPSRRRGQREDAPDSTKTNQPPLNREVID